MRALVWSTVLLVATSGAFAKSLADKKAESKGNKTIEEAMEFFNKKCGTSMHANDVTVKYDSFKWKENYTQGSAANYCVSVLDGVRAVCESGDTEKAYVKKSVKKVVCDYKAGMTTEGFPKEGMKINGGTLTASLDWDTANVSDGVKDYLMNHLE